MNERRGLERLLRLRKLEEETHRLAVEQAVNKRNQSAAQVRDAGESERLGQMELRNQLGASDTAARVAAMIESSASTMRREFLETRLEEDESTLEQTRLKLLEMRTTRLQVERLVESKALLIREQELRRAQQLLDDWFHRKSAVRADAPNRGQKRVEFKDGGSLEGTSHNSKDS